MAVYGSIFVKQYTYFALGKAKWGKVSDSSTG